MKALNGRSNVPTRTLRKCNNRSCQWLHRHRIYIDSPDPIELLPNLLKDRNSDEHDLSLRLKKIGCEKKDIEDITGRFHKHTSGRCMLQNIVIYGDVMEALLNSSLKCLFYL